MVFVDDAAAEKIGQMLDGDTPIEAEAASSESAEAVAEEVKVDAQAEVSDVEASVSDDSSQTAGDVKQEAAEEKAEPTTQEAKADDSAAEEEGESPGHRVPYNRFKKVIDARNEFQTEAEKYKAQVSELQERMKSYSAPQQVQQPVQQQASGGDEAWLQELLGEDGSSAKKPDPALQQLSQRLHETEVMIARQQLEVEISSATEKYPSASRDVILQAVQQNPSVSVEKVAEQYSAWVANMEEAAVAKYLADNPAASAPETKKAAAPPRPKGVGGTKATSTTEKRESPKTVEAASAELRRKWEEINPFAS